MDLSLQQVFDQLFEKYGKRNALYHRGDARIMKMWEHHRNLNKLIRKGSENKIQLGIHLARLFGWTVAYLDSFVDLPIIQAMSEKYPLYGCAYCKEMPCNCQFHQRNNLTTTQFIAIDQLTWTIKQWQEHNENVYGSNNHALGLHRGLNRLTEEITEALCAHHFDYTELKSFQENEHRLNIAYEFADVFQWIFALSNILEVDLELAIKKEYFTDPYASTESA